MSRSVQTPGATTREEGASGKRHHEGTKRAGKRRCERPRCPKSRQQLRGTIEKQEANIAKLMKMTFGRSG